VIWTGLTIAAIPAIFAIGEVAAIFVAIFVGGHDGDFDILLSYGGV